MGEILKNDDSRDYFDLFGDEPSIPDANELLSLKILKDANPKAFEGIAAEETKWIALSLGLLRNDPYLQIRLKGKGIRPAMKLAAHLKRKAEQKNFDQRLDAVINQVNAEKFSKENGAWQHLKALDETGAQKIYNEKAGSWTIDAMGGGKQIVFGATS